MVSWYRSVGLYILVIAVSVLPVTGCEDNDLTDEHREAWLS